MNQMAGKHIGLNVETSSYDINSTGRDGAPELVKDVAVCYKRATEELSCQSELVVSADNQIYCNFMIDKKEEYPF